MNTIGNIQRMMLFKLLLKILINQKFAMIYPLIDHS